MADGFQPVGLTLAGTASASNAWSIIPSGLQDIAAVVGQVRRVRVRVALLAGTLTGVTSVAIFLDERNSSGSQIGAPVNKDITAMLNNGWQNFEFYGTTSTAGCAYITGRLVITLTNGGVVSCTVGVAGWSVE